MKTDDKIQKILETVTEVRVNQAKYIEKVKANTKDIEDNTEEIDALKSDNAKFKGAGVLVGLMGVIASAYKGFFQ